MRSTATPQRSGKALAAPFLAMGALAALALVLLAPGSAVSAKPDNPNPGVFPQNSDPFGLSYGEWGARWWQWAASVPAAQNPIGDTTGEYAALGQDLEGPVWFLAGTWGGTAERTCTVPAGKALFFPLVNVVDCGDPWTVKDTLDIIGQWADTVDGLSCTVDGLELKGVFRYRGRGGDDAGLEVPADNIFGVQAGTYYPLASDGYWIMLEPLTAGAHQIHFTAHAPAFDWVPVVPPGFEWWGQWPEIVQDVTYHLTVEE